MTKEKKYLTFASILTASKFIEKLETQNIGWEMKVGSYPGMWIKISYEDGYKPF